MLTCKHDGCRTCVVARCRFLLLVAGFVLLIDDDQTQIVEREKHGGADAEDQKGLACREEMPIHLLALPVGELGVIDHHGVAEHTVQTLGDLCGERNFGQQVQHLLALRQHLANEVDVDFGLARRGDAVEEGDVGFSPRREDFIVGLLLSRGELRQPRCRIGGLDFTVFRLPLPFSRLGFLLHAPWHGGLIHIAEGREVVGGDPLPEAQLLGRHAALVVEHFEHRLYEADALWRGGMHTEHHAGIVFRLAELDQNSETFTHVLLHLGRNSVGEGFEGYGEYDVRVAHQNM